MDPNMLLGYAFAESLGPAPDLPSSLSSPETRAELVEAVDTPFAGEAFGGEMLPLLDQTVRLLENRLAPDDPCPAVPNPGSPRDRDLALRSGAGRDLGQQVSGADRLSGFEQRVGQRQPQLVAARVTLRPLSL